MISDLSHATRSQASPAVSVIMPVYNGARFLAEAVDSMLAQTLADWELIVVDDGSTDASPQVLSEFKDRRIRVIRQENGGEGAARNTGLDAASGNYVAFLDADDFFAPDGLARMAAYLDGHPGYDVVYSDGVICNKDRKHLAYLSEVRPGSYEGDILEPLVLNNIISAISCTMLRREVIQEQNLRFDTTLKYGVDWDFWLRLAQHSHFAYAPVLTCYYRVHGANMTSTSSLGRRRKDLAVGRLKVMNCDWFETISPATRQSFFYYLLVDLLQEEPGQQMNVVESQQFKSLPVAVRADLLRQVASHRLAQQTATDWAMQCLHESLRLQPTNRKGQTLRALNRLSPALAAAVISAWSTGRRALLRLRMIGKRRPKPVPKQLLPAGSE